MTRQALFSTAAILRFSTLMSDFVFRNNHTYHSSSDMVQQSSTRSSFLHCDYTSYCLAFFWTKSLVWSWVTVTERHYSQFQGNCGVNWLHFISTCHCYSFTVVHEMTDVGVLLPVLFFVWKTGGISMEDIWIWQFPKVGQLIFHVIIYFLDFKNCGRVFHTVLFSMLFTHAEHQWPVSVPVN